MQMMAEAKPHSFAQTVKDWVAEQASKFYLICTSIIIFIII